MTFELRIGLRLHVRDETWTVERIAGTDTFLKNALGQTLTLNSLSLLAEPDFFPIIDGTQGITDPRAVILSTYDPELVQGALEFEAHLLEYRTGFRSGTATLAGPDEPRDLYNPALLTMADRLRNKARELLNAAQPHEPATDGDITREMERLRKRVQAYQRRGLIGLIDNRRLRGKQPTGRHPPEVIAATHQVLRQQERASNRTATVLARQVRLHVELKHGIYLPDTKLRSLRRLVAKLGTFRRLTGKARTRRSRADAPARAAQPIIPTYPGEYVLIDVSPNDFLAIDPLTLTVRRYRLVAAMELYSRCILSARLLPDDPKGVNLAFTMYDIITPKPMMPGWPEEAAYPYTGVPQHMIVRLHGLPEHTQLAGIPSVTPTSVVIDNGKIFRSAHFRNVCHLLGVSIIYARPYTPTDKAQLERWFRTMETQFAQYLSSYLGSDVSERGEKMEDQAVHFANEIEARLGEWIATVYHRQPHSSLHHHDLPRVNLSPNDMFDLGISKLGLITVPLGKDIYYQLLEVIDRKLHHYGVEYMSMLYDHPALGEFKETSSPFGHLDGRWPFHRDPRDPRYLYWQHPATREWVQLTRRDAAFPDAPLLR